MGFSAAQHSSSAGIPSGIFVERFVLGDGPITVAVKDVVDIKGHPTRLGSAAFANAKPAKENAEIVDRLLDGKATIIGKASMHELAYGVTGINHVYGTPENPKYPGLIPGGSSSGSAVAVAAGLCDAAIGTDTGGSIRVPAACCGVLGLKPTYGRVSRNGLTPSNSSLDCVGPFAKNADILVGVMSAIDSSWDEGAASKTSVKIGFLKSDALAEIEQSVRGAAKTLDPDIKDVQAASLEAAHLAGLTIIAHETYAAFGHLLGDEKIDNEVAKRLKRATEISNTALSDAEAVRGRFGQEIDRLLEIVDVLALPTRRDTHQKLEMLVIFRQWLILHRWVGRLIFQVIRLSQSHLTSILIDPSAYSSSLVGVRMSGS